ncbi:nucleotidyltransferase domain-containing protein [Microbacterium sp.]|uniref:nucleotidyltransferase domain-containing protein n=1 Tax=Microbacterium sp. TaxID=51671 RepID=UPI0028118EB6|nr:nucleotidyltransferase domain-containing protein [Microbacterium sp.]
MEHLDLARRFVARHFPAASIAVVAGSTARGTRTATSDIDLLIVGDDTFGGDQESLAAGFEFEGEFIEVFAYTFAGFRRWAERAMAQHRPVVVHMLVEGIEVRGGDELERLRVQWRQALSTGPTVDAHEIAFRRYVITDLLDDLRDGTDPLERHVVASLLFERTAELMLLSGGRWIGAGKYLPRRLREFSAERAEALARPLLDGDLELFVAQVDRELEAAGGRVQAGFVR